MAAFIFELFDSEDDDVNDDDDDGLEEMRPQMRVMHSLIDDWISRHSAAENDFLYSLSDVNVVLRSSTGTLLNAAHSPSVGNESSLMFVGKVMPILFDCCCCCCWRLRFGEGVDWGDVNDGDGEGDDDDEGEEEWGV